MPRTHPPYPPEFRQEAVRLVRESGRPTAELARELGIAPETLRIWVRRAEIDVGDREGLTNEEHEELRRLRRRLRSRQEAYRCSVTSRLCSVLGVTRAGYYSWRGRSPSAHASSDRARPWHARTPPRPRRRPSRGSLRPRSRPAQPGWPLRPRRDALPSPRPRHVAAVSTPRATSPPRPGFGRAGRGRSSHDRGSGTSRR